MKLLAFLLMLECRGKRKRNEWVRENPRKNLVERIRELRIQHKRTMTKKKYKDKWMNEEVI